MNKLGEKNKLSNQTMQLPQEALALLEKIKEKHSISIESLQNEVIQKYSSSQFFQSDTTKSLEQKLLFCTKIIKGAYDNLIPYKDFDVVPMGIGPCRVTKAGVKRGDIHVWTREKNDVDALRSVTVKNQQADDVTRLNLFNLYKGVKLGRFSSGDFSSDHRSVFENPIAINIPPLEIFNKFGVKRCQIKDVLSNLAKKEGNFDKSTDVRIIRGIIINHGSGKKMTDSGVEREWAYYDIYDGSLDDDFTDPDGVVVKTILRVWVHPMWMIYDDDNQIDFVGPLTVYNNGVSMTAYTLLPVYTPTGQLEVE